MCNKRVFVSYSRADSAVVLPMIERLEQALGIRFWVDLHGVESAAQFEEVIMQAIERCDIVLFMLSDNSLRGKWTKREALYAEEMGKRVVPIVIEGGKLRDWFLFHFGSVNYIDADKPDEVDRLTRDMRNWLGLSSGISTSGEPHPPMWRRIGLWAFLKKWLSIKVVAVVILVVLGVVFLPRIWHVSNALSDYEEGYMAGLNSPKGDSLQQVIEERDVRIKEIAESLTPSKENSEPAADQGMINGHEWVDLGLSVRWSTCNVGANSPEEYGDYYAWGETTAKSKYTEENSKTYEKSLGDIAGNFKYDAASANWGGSWRLPTITEIQELVDKCTWVWTAQDGRYGYIVTGHNGKSIFLPAAGYRVLTSSLGTGSFGYYWSSTPYKSKSLRAYHLDFDDKTHDTFWDNRLIGYSVRPVSQ